MLYYGCRHKNEDYLYQEELEEFEKMGVLTKLNVAYSRDTAEKVRPVCLVTLRVKGHLGFC